MRQKVPSINHWIDRLASLHPPQAVAIIGAGTGDGPWAGTFMKTAGLPAVLIEAELDCIEHLKRACVGKEGWQCSHALVAAADGPTCFHQASIRAESGLLPPELLRDVWPNITETHQETRPAMTLGRVLADLDIAANWLWIDCLPALSILDGAADAIAGFDVICARVLLEESHDTRSREAALSCVKASLGLSGFEQVAFDPERNPMIGHALFVRQSAEKTSVITTVNPAVADGPIHHDLLRELVGIDIGTPSDAIQAAVRNTLRSDDLPSSVSAVMSNAGYAPRESYHYLMGVAQALHEQGDKMYGAGLLNEVSFVLDKLPLSYKWHLAKTLIRFGQVNDAYDILTRHLAQGSPLDAADTAKLAEANRRWREQILGNKGHGHEVLIAFLKRHAEQYRQLAGEAKPVLIEIGTTRESASGQGSTRRLMEFCAKESFHFITVDMDSANTEIAAAMFKGRKLAFEAVHSKGEDFLEQYQGRMDFVFLDAYDFDHGMHSERRQSRYEKFLGSRIDEQQCHKMHLDCARSVASKLTEMGVVSIDDTWLDDGKWSAKGTLAVPFLLDAGMMLLDVRNKSALLGRKSWLNR
jgi:hypothetical protein